MWLSPRRAGISRRKLSVYQKLNSPFDGGPSIAPISQNSRPAIANTINQRLCDREESLPELVLDLARPLNHSKAIRVCEEEWGLIIDVFFEVSNDFLACNIAPR